MASAQLQGWRFHNLTGQPVPEFHHPLSRNVFSCAQREPHVFQFVSITFGPVTGDHWDESGSLFFTLTHCIFTYIDKIPLEPALCLTVSAISASFCSSCSQPFNASLLDLAPECPCLSCTWDPSTGPSTPGVSHQAMREMIKRNVKWISSSRKD